MAKITWDNSGEKFFEMGVDHGVLYPLSDEGEYTPGVAWNGLTSVSDSPDGAEANELWADNIKYGVLRSTENHKGTIEAYMFPDEWSECDGYGVPTAGLRIGQQKRKTFGLCYRTMVGNDVDSELGYKLHLVYGATASPSEKTHETVNDSPDAMTMSWEYETVPISVDGYKPTASIEIDSTKLNAAKLAKLETILYGDATSEPRLPLPDEIITMMKGD